MDAYLGEIRMFSGNYAPENWHMCDGSTLLIKDYNALFALLGTTYGGDGVSTFGIPDLRGRVPIHYGTGTGLMPIAIGQKAGAETVTLTVANLPAHTHTLSAANVPANDTNTLNNLPAQTTTAVYVTNPGATTLEQMNAANIQSAYGGQQSLSIVQPWGSVTFIIALLGTYPS